MIFNFNKFEYELSFLHKSQAQQLAYALEDIIICIAPTSFQAHYYRNLKNNKIIWEFWDGIQNSLTIELRNHIEKIVKMKAFF